MSAIIAASRLIGQTMVFQAETSSGFYGNIMMLGSLSTNPGDGQVLSLYSNDDTVTISQYYSYNQPYSGNITIRGNLNMVKYFGFDNFTDTGMIRVAISEVAKLKNLKSLGCGQRLTYVNGNIGNLPSTLDRFYVVAGLLSGNLADLPRTITDFQNSAQNTISGNIADLPPNIIIFGMEGGNSIFGNIVDLPKTIETLFLTGNYSLDIKGLIADIPASMKSFNFSVLGSGYINGDLGDLKEGIVNFNIGGNCTITGDIGNLPTTLLSTTISSNSPDSELTGDLSGLSRAITGFNTDINNHITGDIANIPPLISYFALAGQNTVYGNIGDLQPIMTALFINGDNAVTGDIAGITANLNTIRLRGFNTIYGNVADLKPSLYNVDITGYNELTGDVANIPQNIQNLDIRGANTLYGNLGDIKAQVIRIIGYSTCTYSPTVWHSPMYEITYTPYTTGLTATEVDQLLIDLSAIQWDVFRLIDLRGANAPRTAASNAAITLLQSKGVTTLTN